MPKTITDVKSQGLRVEVKDDGKLAVSYQYLVIAGGEGLYSKGVDVTPFLNATQLAWLQARLDALAVWRKQQEGI